MDPAQRSVQSPSAPDVLPPARPSLRKPDEQIKPDVDGGQGAKEPGRPRFGGFLLLLLAALWAYQIFSAGAPKEPPLGYTSFYEMVQQGKIDKITMTGRTITGHLKAPETIEGRSSQTFTTTLPAQEDRDLMPLLRQQKIDVQVRNDEPGLFTQLLLTVLPWAVLLGGWYWVSSRMQKNMMNGGPLGSVLGRKAKRFDVQESVRVRFDDVAGLGSAKRDLREIVDFLKEPERFRRLGGKVPRGVLLVGPPGTGKTLLARAVAGEAGVPFFSISGSEFIEMFVGVGASRVRELFETAKKSAPAIIFIDEIDAVGRARGVGLGVGNDEREQTLNQLLSEMDGFSRNDLTVVLAATNRPDVLDSALLRPGRFDRRVMVDRPECGARLAILEVHTRDKPVAADVSLRDIAANTPGFSGADLANLVNEAALSATRRGAAAIEAEDFSRAYDKILLGDEREGRLLPEEKLRVAIHESGHAIVAHFTDHAEPLHRVTILPRGMALGVTQQAPGEDKHLVTQPELEAKLRVLMGGFAAESVLLGAVSSGSENDLRKATELAYKMVAHYGMSEKIGPIFHEHHVEHPLLGQRVVGETELSQETVHTIEEEARRLLGAAFEDAKSSIARHRAALERLVKALLDKETVERKQLVDLLAEPLAAE